MENLRSVVVVSLGGQVKSARGVFFFPLEQCTLLCVLRLMWCRAMHVMHSITAVTQRRLAFKSIRHLGRSWDLLAVASVDPGRLLRHLHGRVGG